MQIYHIPIATTLISILFFIVLIKRYKLKGRGAHLLWWAAGVFTYGLGTAIESTITLSGNSIFLNKFWYIAGALLGGYPLAEGTVYLILKKRTADVLTVITCTIILLLTVAVIVSPVHADLLNVEKPSGDILAWTWIRWFTPIVNGYAAIFLIGGAIYSSVKFFRDRSTYRRAVGTALIALGGLLPGIGGSMAKAGIVEGLYIGEFLGIIVIWVGYNTVVNAPLGKEMGA